MKKFYALVSLHEDKPNKAYHVHLDGRAVKCPSGQALSTASKPLAEAIIQEWAAQEEQILPDTMPLTQILTTRLDRVSQERAAMSEYVLKYLNTDLLCYRAGEEPAGQAKAQEAAWDPWLQWFEVRFNIPLATTASLSALTQPEAAHKAVRGMVEALHDDTFTALQLVASLSGSIILGLAFIERVITPQQIFDASHVEEHFKAKIYNEELHGPDPAQEKQDADMQRDLKAAAQFLKLIDTGGAHSL